jgi:hypothetical protein
MFPVMGSAEPTHVERRGIIIMMGFDDPFPAHFATRGYQLAATQSCLDNIQCALALWAKPGAMAFGVSAL